jgi:GNAT superfamily N-acetyltransferase
VNLLPTKELATLIEASERRLLRGFFEAARTLRPDSSFECLDIAGGLAAFTGNGSPLSQATSLALEHPIAAGEIERVSRFYRDRGAPARVWANPLADASLERLLAAAGYVPAGRNNVLAIDAARSTAARDPRFTEETDVDAWGRASAHGFSNRYASDEEGAFLAKTIAFQADVVALAARNGAGIVATGAMCVHGELASLFAGSTLDDYRRQGYHRALILDRIARAREAGARYARTSAPIGSTSEVNFRRCGFQVLYTRTLWELQR